MRQRPGTPVRHHGPHLYLKFSAQNKAHSLYVPLEQSELSRRHRARLGLQDAGAQIAAGNRERLLRELQRDKAAHLSLVRAVD